MDKIKFLILKAVPALRIGDIGDCLEWEILRGGKYLKNSNKVKIGYLKKISCFVPI